MWCGAKGPAGQQLVMDHRVGRPNLPVERQRPNGMERLMRATIDTPAHPDSTESATAALASVLAGRSGLTMILFRDDQSARARRVVQRPDDTDDPGREGRRGRRPGGRNANQDPPGEPLPRTDTQRS